MENIKKVFVYLSYIQYPLGILALAFTYKPILFGIETFWSDLNISLIFMGLAVSFSTLQDTTKVQNKMSLRVWENPKYARMFLIYLGLMILLIMGFGLFGYFVSENQNIQEVAFGAIALSIGLIGLLKAALEMAAFHGKKEK
jgi:predicted lysophospholipase L1 biosynthesis ABC-type transport system permease subunit